MLLSQHDWLKIGFKKIDGSGSDGYLDPDAPPAFFTNLVKSFDTDDNGELSSEEIQAALQNSSNAAQLHKLIVKHPSEWYEKSSASSYQWLDKLMTKIGLPDFDKLVDHEKQRIDKLEWMQSATKLKLGREIWHLYPLFYFRTNTVPMLSDARVRAFMRMLRVGEGTIGDKGYETLFSGKSFIKDYSRDFSDHPRIKIKSGKLVSSAAGAYQVMGYTWDDPSMVKARDEYHINDFSPLSQDIFCLFLFKKKREGTLDKIRQGDIEGALDKLSYEWASRPPGRYGQPSKTMSEALSIFESYLDEELNGKTDLKIPVGVTNDF